MSINIIAIEGRVGSDPVMEKKGDQDFTKFLIYHGQDNQEFKITATAWGKVAGVCVKYLRKGMRGVTFQGRLRGNKWTKGGKDYWFYEIVLELVHFPPVQSAKKEDDLPF
jgi:single-stranded DNA-binding protein